MVGGGDRCVHLQLLSESGLSTTHDMDLSHVPKLTGKFSSVRNFSFTMAMTLLTALLGTMKLLAVSLRRIRSWRCGKLPTLTDW
jgi:hypothetical protein